MNEIGNRIRELRLMLNRSLRDFSKDVGVSIGLLSELENGRRAPSPRVVAVIALKCSASEHWLLTGEGPMFVRRVEIPDQVEATDDLAVAVVNQETGETRQVRAGPERPVVALPDHHLADLVKDLAAWWQQASADERAWLRVHLRREIPGFGRKPRPRKKEQP